MAANILNSDANSTGKAFARQAGSARPWWGAGFEIKGNDVSQWMTSVGVNHLLRNVEAHTIRQTLLADAIARQAPITAELLASLLEPVDDIHVLQRDDNGKNVCSVGRNTHALQYSDCFRAMEPFIAAGKADFDTAMLLDGGRKFVVTAALRDGEREIRKGDPVKRHMFLAHAHDGTLAIHYGLSLTRIVCENTLSMALADKKSNLFKFRHTKDAAQNVHRVAEFLAAADNVFTATESAAKAMASATNITQASFTDYMKTVFKIKENETTGKLSTRSQNTLDSLVLEYHRQRGAAGINAVSELLAERDQATGTKVMESVLLQAERGTSAVNAVAELMQDAERRAEAPDAGKATTGFTWYDAYNVATNRLRDMGHTPETRAASNLFGANKKTNDTAFELAMKMSGVSA
jgi:phage/plasmid-like protein (TIGR03299 family)